MIGKILVAFSRALSWLATGFVGIYHNLTALMVNSWLLVTRARGDIPTLYRLFRAKLVADFRAGSVGAISVDAILMAFVAVVVIYQLIIQIGSLNVQVQNASNVSTTGKWAASLGEWLFPLLAIFAIVGVFMKRGGFRGKSKK